MGFQKGEKNPNFGHPLSEEHRRKISLAQKGRKLTKKHIEKLRKAKLGVHLSEEHKKNIGKNSWKNRKKRSGWKLSSETIKRMTEFRRKNPSKHWNWKGGITPENAKIRRSVEYRIWRDSVLKRDSYTCVWCGVKGVELNADHIKPFAYFPEFRLDVDNGRTLCVSCHSKTDTYRKNVYGENQYIIAVHARS